MRTYTPDGSTYHDTAALPEDGVDYRNAASVGTGIEAALDNAEFAVSFGTRIRDLHFASTSGVAVAFNCDSATSTTWQDTGLTVAVDCEPNDRVLVFFCFDTDPNSCTGGECRLVRKQASAATTELAGTEKRVVGADLFPRTLTSVFQATHDETYTIELQVMCTAGDWDVCAGVTRTALVIAQKDTWPT